MSDYVEDSEKGIVLSSIVKQTVATKKDRVGLKLSPVAELHDPKFLINVRMGAGTALIPDYPTIHIRDFKYRQRFLN